MNIHLTDVPSLHKKYRNSFKQFESIQVTQGRGEMRSGIYYYVFNETELNTIRTELQTFIATKK